MKQGRTLTELATEIERRRDAKHDLIVPAAKMGMSLSGALMVEGEPNRTLNSVASGQLAEYIGIPKAYYDRCLNTAPAILSSQVNHWLEEKNGERRMVRTIDGHVNAFLSDRYRSLDYEDLAEAVLPVLLDMNLLILSTQITDRRLYIKAVHRSIERDVPTGRKMGDGFHAFFDTCVPAITISDSEVGFGRLSIESGVYTKACTNLALIGAGFKKQHVGGKADMSEDVYKLLTDDTRRLNDAAVWATVKDVVRGAFDEAKFKALTEKIGAASEDKITGDPVQAVEVLGKRNTLDDPTRKSILRHLIEGADLSRYGLHAAVTRASQEVEDYDVATNLERLGGQVIELPRNEWLSIAAAA